VKNVNHVSANRNSISGNYFANFATDASYDRQAVTNFLRAECNTSDPENYIISDYEVYRSLSRLQKTPPGPDQIPTRFINFVHTSYIMSSLI